MKNKRGVELGISEIVGIILAIAALAFGLVFIRHYSEKGEGLLEEEVDARALENARTVLDAELNDKSFVISNTAFKISRGESEVFLIGIKNVRTESSDFEIQVKHTEIDTDSWFVYKKTTVTLNANEKEYFTSKITVPDAAGIGDYLFDVVLLSSENEIDSENILVSVD